MKISVKGRYGLSAMVYMAAQTGSNELITILSISEKLGISKIYLEQTFSLLKRAGLVTAVKGAQGGYQLARMPRQITVFAILSAIETALFEKTETTVEQKLPALEIAMQLSAFTPLSSVIETTLTQITLQDLAEEMERHRSNTDYMFFI